MAGFSQAPPPPSVPPPRLQGAHCSMRSVVRSPTQQPDSPTELDLSCYLRDLHAAARPPPHRQVLRARVLRRPLPPRAPEVTHHSPIFFPLGLGDGFVLISRPGCVRKMGFCGARSGRVVRSWLLEPLRNSNLELFALVAVWIASKVRHCESFLDRTLACRER